MRNTTHKLNSLLPEKLSNIREKKTRQSDNKIYNFFAELNALSAVHLFKLTNFLTRI
jgi:hypothetical protein